MEGFSSSFEEHMTLKCITSLCLQIYQVTCKYQRDFFLQTPFLPCQSFRNIFKSLSSLSLVTFLLIRYGTSFLNLKAHFLQYKKNNSTLNCTHCTHHEMDLKRKKERESILINENMSITANVISSCMTYLCYSSVLFCFFKALVHCKNNLSIPWSRWLHQYIY